MIRRMVSVVAFSVLLLDAGCHSGTLEPPGPVITATTISADQLPAEFDGTRTYHYRAAGLQDPEHMIRALWQAGFHTTRAWQPLDNPSCADPLGPTFTVELEVDSPAIVDNGFQRGAGRLFCATTLTEFSVASAVDDSSSGLGAGRDFAAAPLACVIGMILPAPRASVHWSGVSLAAPTAFCIAALCSGVSCGGPIL